VTRGGDAQHRDERGEEPERRHGTEDPPLLLGHEQVGEQQLSPDLPADFVAALDDDLGVPGALAVVHNAVRDGNTALSAGDKDTVIDRLVAVRSMLAVLGLDPVDEMWAGGAAGRGSDTHLRKVVDALVAVTLEQRQAARARKDYAAADAIRDQLAALGILIEDTPTGPRWSLAGRAGAEPDR